MCIIFFWILSTIRAEKKRKIPIQYKKRLWSAEEKVILNLPVERAKEATLNQEQQHQVLHLLGPGIGWLAPWKALKGFLCTAKTTFLHSYRSPVAYEYRLTGYRSYQKWLGQQKVLLPKQVPSFNKGFSKKKILKCIYRWHIKLFQNETFTLH